MELCREDGEDYDKGMGHKNKKMHRVIEVAGFVGSIEVTEDSDRQALKEQVTVKLSEAATAAENAGLDVKKGKIGVVTNENDDQYLAWTLIEVEKDLEAETGTITVYVVDAVNSSNTATFTEEIDFSERDGKRGYNGENNMESDLA